MTGKTTTCFLLLTAALVLLFTGTAGAASRLNIVLVTAGTSQPYSQVEEESAHSLTRLGWLPVRQRIVLTDGRQEPLQPPRQTDLIIALGQKAVDLASRTAPRIPLVAALFVDPAPLRARGNANGILVGAPPEAIAGWIRAILPDARTVGMVHAPMSSGILLHEEQKAANAHGLDLLFFPINDPRGIPGMFEQLREKVDLFRLAPDPALVTAQTARVFLLFSFRNRIPLVGLSDSWVRAGALFALENDFDDVGDQLARLADQLLKKKTSAVAVAYPRRQRLLLNLRSAERMGITLPDRVLRVARKTYR